MHRYLLCAAAGVLFLSSAAQAWAPYVGANEADNEFWRITPAHMAVIAAKKGMVTSRSYGQNLFHGVGRVWGQNAVYKLYYSTNVLDAATKPLTDMPSNYFEDTSPYHNPTQPNTGNKILHYMCKVSQPPETKRIDDFNYYLGTSPYQWGSSIDWGLIELHSLTDLGPQAFFDSWKQKCLAIDAAYPNFKLIWVTSGILPSGYMSSNDAGWQFSDRMMNPANGIRGVKPLFDWRSLHTVHADGTPSAGHYMCPEFSFGEPVPTHPNQPFIEKRLGQALLLMLYKLYCNPPLTAIAGFDRTWYDNNDDDVETVTLDGSASYDPGSTSIVSYVWRENGTTVATGVSATVSLGIGQHTITLTVTNNAATPATSSDNVIVTVAKPKLLVADAGPDQTVVNNAGVVVQFDGGGSYATGGRSIVSYVWKDAGRVLVTSTAFAPPYVQLMQNGVHPITLTVTDNALPPNVDTDSMTLNLIQPNVRTSEGLQALYTFKEGSGATVNDVSRAYATAMNLTIGTPGAVTWTSGASGYLTVNSSVLIATASGAERLYDAIVPYGNITLEAWIQPAAAAQNGPAAIMSMSADYNTRCFLLGQGLAAPGSAACYTSQLRGTGTNSAGEPAVVTPDGSAAAALQHVVYTREGSSAATMYINGAAVATGVHEGLLYENIWDRNDRLALANEVIGGRPWLGRYYLAAIYNRVLSSDEVNRNYTVGANPTTTPGAPRILGWEAALQRGTLDQELAFLTDSPMYVECRRGALNTVWAIVTKPLNPATVSKTTVRVTGTRSGDITSQLSSVTVDATRRVIVFQMPSMPAADKIKFELLSTIRDPYNQQVSAMTNPSVANLNVTVGSLVGDVDGSGKVTPADMLAVRNRVGQAATGASAKYDIDCSGEITGADVLLVHRNLEATLP